MAMRGAGQPRWTAEEAQRVLDAWDESGQSGAAFARSIGVGYQRLSWWRRRLAQTGRAPTSTLVPVIVRVPVPRSGVAAGRCPGDRRGAGHATLGLRGATAGVSRFPGGGRPLFRRWMKRSYERS